jgi:hypothetical protein
VENLEREIGGDANAKPFYILWVAAGADRTAALAELRTSGEIPADVFATVLSGNRQISLCATIELSHRNPAPG